MNLLNPVVLLIDDQWGRDTDPLIEGTYGRLPIQWKKSTARSPSGTYSMEAALTSVKATRPAVVLLDIDFGGGNTSRLGVEILQAIRQEFPVLPVLMFTSLDSAEYRELVIRCLEHGANEYVEKAPAAGEMATIVQVYTNPGSDTLYGNSSAIRHLRAGIARVAFSGDTSVVIVGASGTGKELAARALHRHGPHRSGPFVAKNCAYTDLTLLDSELFGHEKGAFTGALAARRGLIEEADGGTLFLDEVADMPVELQAKLLRALETRTIRRVGGSEELRSRFQLVCSTNRSPEQLVESGKLREDFYYRIATMTLHVPRLAERREDIPILAELFLQKLKLGGGASYIGKKFSPRTLRLLARHDWPGNVRELRNVIERAVIFSRHEVIGPSELPDGLGGATSEAQSRRIATRTSIAFDEKQEWPLRRVKAEVLLALEAKRQVQAYKHSAWKAEFMRLMYPECRAASAKGFADLLRRLTKGPWGYPEWGKNSELAALIRQLRQ